MTDSGLMPMSDVPMLAWSNRPIPIPMFKASFQPVICNASTLKIPKNATHARMESVLSSYPCVACLALFVCVHCLFHFLICNTDPACAEYDMLETGFHTATVPDNYCGREGTSMLISATQVKCLV